MKKLRVMMLTHSYMVPPDDLVSRDDRRMEKFRTEFDVREALISLGHDVRILGINDDMTPIRKTIREWKPHIAFNLMEAFAEVAALDYYIVSYLHMADLPFTGCNARGLLLARDKAISKKLLSFHRILVPRFFVFPKGKKINRKKAEKLPYPLIVKSTVEEGSIGIAQASYVSNSEELVQRTEHLIEMTQGDVIAEQYIEGRELYVSMIGNNRLEVFPFREIVFDKIDENMHRIATYTVKWNENYRKKWGIEYQFARTLPEGMKERIEKLAKRIYKILDMTGYARIDLRITTDGKIYVLEANPNAAIASDDDFALAAVKAGYSYPELIQKIVNLGLQKKA